MIVKQNPKGHDYIHWRIQGAPPPTFFRFYKVILRNVDLETLAPPLYGVPPPLLQEILDPPLTSMEYLTAYVIW